MRAAVSVTGRPRVWVRPVAVAGRARRAVRRRRYQATGRLSLSTLIWPCRKVPGRKHLMPGTSLTDRAGRRIRSSRGRLIHRWAGRPAPGSAWRSVEVDGHRVRYGVAGTGPAALFLHGWGLRPNAYRGPIEAMAAAGCRVYAPCPPRVRRDPRAATPNGAPSPATPDGWGTSSTRWASPRWPWSPATPSGAVWPPPSSTTSPPGCRPCCWSTPSAARPGPSSPTRSAPRCSVRCGTGGAISGPTSCTRPT